MAVLQLWVVYNIDHNLIYITRGRKLAVRIAGLMNKTYKLLNSKTYVLCDTADKFFRSHTYDKNSIHYCWPINSGERMSLQQLFIKMKVL